MNISIIGSGGWGTAMAIMLANYNHNVTLWSYSQVECDELIAHRQNIPYLPGHDIPESIHLTTNIEECANAELIVCALPSFAVRKEMQKLAPYVRSGQVIANISKGLENDTLLTLSEVLRQVLPTCEIAVMSGPSHAEEVASKIPTTNVVAANSLQVAQLVQDAFMNPFFRVYTSGDVRGVELGGSLKNIIALCAGISDGLGFGDNTKAALMTRGICEITRLGVAMGASPATFSGLSGIGDLIVTCTSMHSRNRRAGILIGQGKTPEEASREIKMVIEGVSTCKAAHLLAQKLGVEMPIVSQAYAVLFEGMPAREATLALMARDRKHEVTDGFLIM